MDNSGSESEYQWRETPVAAKGAEAVHKEWVGLKRKDGSCDKWVEYIYSYF
jgi:hypothetical protein